MDPQIQQAIAIIDPDSAARNRDYVIDLKKHIDLYRETAPDLAALLDSSGARTLAQEYWYRDTEAIKEQQNFQSCSRKARGWVFATAGFTALSLATALLLGGGAISSVVGEAVARLPGDVTAQFPLLGFAQGIPILIAVLALFAAISGAAANVYLNRIQAGRLLESWKEARAQAESYRRDYFNYLSQASAGSSNPVPLPLLQFEYFRRYQFDVQYAYYQQRSEDHRGYADRSLKLSTAAMATVVLLNSLSSAGTLSAFNLRLIAAGAFALLVQAFANMVINREEVQQNRHKADLYAKTRTVLAQLSANLDGIRQAVLEGNTELFASFVKATHDVLSKEHEEWLKSFDDVHSAVGQLLSQLDEWKTKSSLQNPPEPAGNKPVLENLLDNNRPVLENLLDRGRQLLENAPDGASSEPSAANPDGPGNEAPVEQGPQGR